MRAEREGRPISARLRELARAALERALRGAMPRPLMEHGAWSPGGSRAVDWPASELPPLEVRWKPPTDYERSLDRVGAQVDSLTQHLDEILRPRKRSRLKGGYASGQRVDLKKLMAFEADPRRYDDLWQRLTIPDRREVVIGLLVDLSGSMSGEKVVNAVLGTVLVGETLSRLGITFAIHGFQDVLIPFCEYNQDYDDSVRSGIGQMIQEVNSCREGGNNQPSYNDDGPCLMECAELLLAQPATERILIVVSDGLPAGRRSSTEDLHSAVRALTEGDSELELIGLGLGPDTEHVNDFYPSAVANVPVEAFAREIGRLVEALVLGTAEI
jgi:hypothetical protein